MIASGVTTFANHRAVTPQLWAFCALATLELIVVHLFVALRWPRIGWPLTLLSAAAIVWLAGWIRSWPKLPHELHHDRLILHMGSLRSVTLPLDQIAGFGPSPSLANLSASGARVLTIMAAPNRIISLRSPLAGRGAAMAVAISLDDPVQFDAAMTAALVRAETP